MRDNVAGIEMWCARLGNPKDARFYHQKVADGFEVVMVFKGNERRFAFCTHENDAEAIVEAFREARESCK